MVSFVFSKIEPCDLNSKHVTLRVWIAALPLVARNDGELGFTCGLPRKLRLLAMTEGGGLFFCDDGELGFTCVLAMTQRRIFFEIMESLISVVWQKICYPNEKSER